MILDDPIRQVETARAELGKVADSTGGWSDEKRQAFDSHRMSPLDAAGGRLLSQLRTARERCMAAERLLSPDR